MSSGSDESSEESCRLAAFRAYNRDDTRGGRMDASPRGIESYFLIAT